MKVLFVAGSLFMLASNIGMIFITTQTSIWLASFFNAVRCVAIGCLMMPLVTWGINGVSKVRSGLTAHGTALLTSLRTIAGAIGTAIFVAIMTWMSETSVDTYGEEAAMHGLNVTFLAMSLSTLALVIIAVFFVPKKDR